MHCNATLHSYWALLWTPGACPGAFTLVGCAVGGVLASSAVGTMFSLSLSGTLVASAVVLCVSSVLVACRCCVLVRG